MFEGIMVEILLPLMVLVSVCVLLILFQQRQLLLKHVRQRRGLETLCQLKRLIILVQQHRGVSLAVKNSELGMKSRQLELQVAIGTIRKVLERECTELRQMERWNQTTQHWDSLRRRLDSLAANEAMNQHNCLIANLLNVVEELVARSGLSDVDLPGNFQGSLLWGDLLHISECIGQARGLGTGIAAAGYCSSGDRISMLFLKEKIRKTADKSLAAICQMTVAGIDSRQELERQLVSLLDAIEMRLIATEGPTIDAEEFFALATDMMDRLLHLFDVSVDELQQLLGNTSIGLAPEVHRELLVKAKLYEAVK